MDYRAKAIAAHRSNYPQPIRLTAGERVILGKRDTKYGDPGWIWVTADRQGWVPEQILTPDGEVTEDYRADELDTQLGEDLLVLRELNGWCWVRNQHGHEGWVPLATIEKREDVSGPSNEC